MFGFTPVYAASPDDSYAVKCLKRARMVELGALVVLLGICVLLLAIIDAPSQPFRSATTWIGGVMGAAVSATIGAALLKLVVYGLVTRMHVRKGTIVRVDAVVLQARHPDYRVSRILWERVKPELRYDLQKAYESSPEAFNAALPSRAGPPKPGLIQPSTMRHYYPRR